MTMLEATSFIKEKLKAEQWQNGIILGSGLGKFAQERLVEQLSIPYEDIPGFPRSTVEGHEGNFVFGKIGATRVLCMSGRFHFYEGYPMEQLILPIRVMAELGVKTLIVTNAAGGINPDFEAGTLMLITDHINFMGTNPLIGPNYKSLGTRFPDMSQAYDPGLIARAEFVARAHNIELRKGVYLATSGPSYETPAEIKAFRALGADAVGMSTVPEVIAARHAGIKVLGISCITNKAAGLSETPLSHREVTETANRVKEKFGLLLEKFICTPYQE